jgi:hypothetical protein
MVDKRVVLAQFADCLARLGPGLSDKLLNTDFGSDAERNAAEIVVHAHSSCMTDRMVLSMQPGMIRGLIAESMLKRHHPDWLAAANAMPASTPIRPARPLQASAQSADVRDAKRERAFMAAYSKCLVKASPAKVGTLLSTGIATPEEHAALMDLGTDLNDCLPMRTRYVLNDGGLRANLASALYLDFSRHELPGAAQ